MDIKKKLLDGIAHPNSLTMFRIAAVPLLIALMLSSSRWSGFFAVIVFSAAAVTDYFDGYVARRFGLVSSLGKIMDPLQSSKAIKRTELPCKYLVKCAHHL